MPKLYQIPRGSTILCETTDGSKRITFHKIDGAYSYCTTEKGNVVHIAAWQPLTEVEAGVYQVEDMTPHEEDD